MGLTAFTKKPTSPKVETKKTETLDSVLVAKNFYRVRDAYATKLYGQDESEYNQGKHYRPGAGLQL